MCFEFPAQLKAACSSGTDGSHWLSLLPDIVNDLEHRWSLTLGPPFERVEMTSSWVAPVTLKDGATAVLKIGRPHFEAEHEIEGLRFWNGNPTVRLLAADADRNAVLLEQCRPGTPLRDVPEPEQDIVIAGLLHRLWREPDEFHCFRPLSAMTSHWANETREQCEHWVDAGLVRMGLTLLEQLSQSARERVLLATDLHAGNVLQSEREPWLVIDPKPFCGDPAYDVTQHLLNCPARLQSDPRGTIRRLADLACVDPDRLRLWMFARLAAEPRGNWDDEPTIELSRALAP